MLRRAPGGGGTMPVSGAGATRHGQLTDRFTKEGRKRARFSEGNTVWFTSSDSEAFSPQPVLEGTGLHVFEVEVRSGDGTIGRSRRRRIRVIRRYSDQGAK